jgi:hypothetical protein
VGNALGQTTASVCSLRPYPGPRFVKRTSAGTRRNVQSADPYCRPSHSLVSQNDKVIQRLTRIFSRPNLSGVYSRFMSIAGVTSHDSLTVSWRSDTVFELVPSLARNRRHAAFEVGFTVSGMSTLLRGSLTLSLLPASTPRDGPLSTENLHAPSRHNGRGELFLFRLPVSTALG